MSSSQSLKNKTQYNEPLKRSELLASHGVGALKLTTWGVVMTHSIDRWPLLKTVREALANRNEVDMLERKQVLRGALEASRIHLVEDPRFVRFLQESRGYTALEYLVAVPQVELSRFNTIRPAGLRDFLPPSAVHFPKYLYDPSRTAKERHLRIYKDALKKFQDSFNVPTNASKFRFVPPRSARYVPGGPQNLEEQAASRPLLEPVPLVLICPHGHIADVPWAKFLGAQMRQRQGQTRPPIPGRTGIFHHLFDEADCCATPQLLWQGGGLSSDSYAGVVLRCSSCNGSTNLAQVGRLRPTCNGGRPWIAADDYQHCTQAMQRGLTTGNNLYFPLAYTGLYLPEKLLLEAPAPAAILETLEGKYAGTLEENPDRTRHEYWTLRVAPTNGANLRAGLSSIELGQLRRDFVQETPAPPLDESPTERLKRQEYEVFTGHEQVDGVPDFAFRNVPLADLGEEDDSINDPTAPCLSGRIKQVRRVDELRITRVQLAFTRVQPLDPDALDEAHRLSILPQRVHQTERTTVQALPALASSGEGIFLELDLDAVARWEKGNWEHGGEIAKTCSSLMQDVANPLNEMQRQKASQATPRQLLVHTLSHLLIRELEWKCGYPAASVQERIYVRPATPDHPGHAGILLYATEGSQGSMGGLTHQARPAFMRQLLREALLRATDCPADPICWHADAQAGTPLVRAACFACAMTSETSCELQNTLLDRRLLIDPEFGFFSATFSAVNR
ncbi:hypothetical protein SAMN00120144_2112 [Hymenobacter roseosalivarius DSM 11622]|uniref:MrfA-like Zn-binding domain-containing protein n=1 Tax=Hymenobacter roseosalivarius DSM 11622 TaxID=645990 RepID=A0A1W1VGV7_9BACT|nr:DUF1998 domain-containing protein [Hymenobacter roseosalivarius]SMB92184.1 hypothetical protein SAMN00120144_2112 [Hymenobacter roseosalivarius DSM 11622]